MRNLAGKLNLFDFIMAPDSHHASLGMLLPYCINFEPKLFAFAHFEHIASVLTWLWLSSVRAKAVLSPKAMAVSHLHLVPLRHSGWIAPCEAQLWRLFQAFKRSPGFEQVQIGYYLRASQGRNQFVQESSMLLYYVMMLAPCVEHQFDAFMSGCADSLSQCAVRCSLFL